MCGIAGAIALRRSIGNPELATFATVMRDSMTHRGPDDFGLWTDADGACVLAHRRLSIIDLTAEGRQPMGNEDGSVWVTFNGEIYNYRQIRQRLEALGHVFHSHSDTEVLPHLFEEMRPEALLELDGMFALGVWHRRKRQLILARDPFGKKPLYYAQTPECFGFASELQALRALPGFDARVDGDALSQYLLLQYVPAPLTIFAGAKKLPPGHYLVADFSTETPKITISQYFAFQATQPPGQQPLNVRTAELKTLTIEAVRKRLVADVPIGAFLSGGVDSSLVAAIATRELGMKLKTFTIGFEGSADSEHEAARQVASHLGTEHYEKIIKPDAIAMADEIAGRLDEPNGDSSCLPTLLLCQHAREHVTVALSGDGGDEMFGGYGRYRDTLNEAAAFRPGILQSLGLRRGWTASHAYLSPRWLIFQPEQVAALLDGMPSPTARLLEIWRRQLDDRRLPLLHRMRNLDVHTYLPGAVLAKVDRMSMQVSLEVRCPLLDRDVARFAQAVSVDDCWQAPLTTKRILKRLAASYLPEEWMNRRKLGFGLPANAWSKEQVLALAEKVLLADDSRLPRHVVPQQLRMLVARQSEANGFSIYQIWPLLILEFWLRKNTH